MGDTTSTKLLDAVRSAGADEAWAVFYRRYAPIVLRAARYRGCTGEEAKDVLQETMVRLLRALPGFEYQRQRGTFRSYVRRIALNVLASAHRRRNVRPEGNAVPLEETSDGLAEAWDSLWRQQLLATALDRVRQRVGTATFRSFEMAAFDGLPAARISATLGLTENSIYQNRHRVVRLLRDEVARLENEWQD